MGEMLSAQAPTQAKQSRLEWAIERLSFTLLFVALWLGINKPPLRWIGVGLFAVSIVLELRHPWRPTGWGAAAPGAPRRRDRLVAWLGRQRRNWIFRGIVVAATVLPVAFDLPWRPYRWLGLCIVGIALLGEIWLGPPATRTP